MCSDNGISVLNADITDLDELYEIEASSFAPGMAASKDAFRYRLENHPQWFFKAVSDGRIVGLVNGSSSTRRYITDDLYQDGAAFDEQGTNLLIYGLAVHPDYRKRGIAHKLLLTILASAGAHGKDRVSLTCKQHLIGFYESFGFTNHGISESVAGGVTSYDLEIGL